jgi:hypothetical protein
MRISGLLCAWSDRYSRLKLRFSISFTRLSASLNRSERLRQEHGWDDPLSPLARRCEITASGQIPSSWFRSRAAYTFHERLREIILSEYGARPLIVIKEPRICPLAPLYLDVLDALE